MPSRESAGRIEYLLKLDVYCSYKKRDVLTLFPVQKTLGVVHGLLVETTHMGAASSFD